MKKIGNVEVDDDVYFAFKCEKAKWCIFNYSIWWLGVGLMTFAAMCFWFFVAKVDFAFYKKGYIQACKDNNIQVDESKIIMKDWNINETSH